jgi:hypothetical protein
MKPDVSAEKLKLLTVSGGSSGHLTDGPDPASVAVSSSISSTTKPTIKKSTKESI